MTGIKKENNSSTMAEIEQKVFSIIRPLKISWCLCAVWIATAPPKLRPCKKISYLFMYFLKFSGGFDKNAMIASESSFNPSSLGSFILSLYE